MYVDHKLGDDETGDSSLFVILNLVYLTIHSNLDLKYAFKSKFGTLKLEIANFLPEKWVLPSMMLIYGIC